MRVLVLYHSRTGLTYAIARLLALKLGADLGEIRCPAYGSWFGPLARAWDVVTRHHPQVETTSPVLPEYDLVIVGAPVWAGRVAPPALRVLADQIKNVPRVALFLTCGHASHCESSTTMLAEMAALVPGQVVGTEVFFEAEVASGEFRKLVGLFAESLTAKSLTA